MPGVVVPGGGGGHPGRGWRLARRSTHALAHAHPPGPRAQTHARTHAPVAAHTRSRYARRLRARRSHRSPRAQPRARGAAGRRASAPGPGPRCRDPGRDLTLPGLLPPSQQPRPLGAPTAAAATGEESCRRAPAATEA